MEEPSLESDAPASGREVQFSTGGHLDAAGREVHYLEDASGAQAPVDDEQALKLQAKLRAFSTRKRAHVETERKLDLEPGTENTDGCNKSEELSSKELDARGERPEDPASAKMKGSDDGNSEQGEGVGDEEDTESSPDTSLKPLRAKIGLAEPRHERPVYKGLLEEPVVLIGKKRSPFLSRAIARGFITDKVRAYVITVHKRIVSFLLSSTFTDTEWERNLLLEVWEGHTASQLSFALRAHRRQILHIGNAPMRSQSEDVCLPFLAAYTDCFSMVLRM